VRRVRDYALRDRSLTPHPFRLVRFAHKSQSPLPTGEVEFGISGVWVFVPASAAAPSLHLLPLRFPRSVCALRATTRQRGGGRSVSAVPVAQWGAQLAPAVAALGHPLSLSGTARGRRPCWARPVLTASPRLPGSKLAHRPLRLVTPTAGRNAGGLLTGTSRGTGLRIPPARVSPHRRPEYPGSRRRHTPLRLKDASRRRPSLSRDDVKIRLREGPGITYFRNPLSTAHPASCARLGGPSSGGP